MQAERWYRVQCRRSDGTIYLSRAYPTLADAERWVTYWRMVRDVSEVRILICPEPLKAA